LNSNIIPNGTSKEEINTVLVHAETSGINHHSPLLMPKVPLENIIYPTVKFTLISMDNTSMLTILNGQTQMLKLITTVHGSVLQMHHGEFISHKTVHGAKVSLKTVLWLPQLFHHQPHLSNSQFHHQQYQPPQYI
jgi:hypothetical protein